MKSLIYLVIPIFLFGFFGFVLSNNSNNTRTTTIQKNECPICSLLNLDEKQPAGEKTNGATPITLTEQNFESEVLNSDKPVVVDFYAKWCGVCKKLSPVFDELSSENDEMLKFGKVDVDENPNLTSKYNIDAIPRVIVFHKGKIVKDIEGYHSKAELKSQLEEVCQKCSGM